MSRDRARSIAPYLEIAILVGALALVNLIFAPNDPGFVAVRPHPILFITIIVVARYGFTAGVVAATTCAAEYAAMFLALSKRPPYDLLSWGPATPLVVLVPTTVFLGMLVQHHLDRRRRADAELTRARTELAELQASIGSLRDINVELAERIVNAQSTRLLLIDQLKLLVTVDRKRLEPIMATVLAEVLHAESTAVWRADGSTLTLAASLGAPARAFDAEVERYFGETDVLAAHDVPAWSGSLPLLFGRVRAGRGGPVLAWVAADGLSLQAAPEASEMFTALVAWFTESMGQAIAFERLQQAPARSGIG